MPVVYSRIGSPILEAKKFVLKDEYGVIRAAALQAAGIRQTGRCIDRALRGCDVGSEVAAALPKRRRRCEDRQRHNYSRE